MLKNSNVWLLTAKSGHCLNSIPLWEQEKTMKFSIKNFSIKDFFSHIS